MRKKKYFAFISYSHKDSELAKWLQHEFEYYELPSTLNGRKDLPKSFRPIFRDEDELAGGELKPQISEALADSEYLIAVCSPNSAQSVYVDNEIREFIALSQDNKRKIFPFIIDGKPHQDEENKENECFPKILLELSEDKTDPIELIAGDIKATGRDHAFVKILAGTLNEKDVRFAELWDRYAIEKAEKERKEREDKEKLLIAQGRFLAEKANDYIEKGDSYIARKALLELYGNPEVEYPYVAEADKVFRRAVLEDTMIIDIGKEYGRVNIASISLSKDGSIFAIATYKNSILLYNAFNGKNLSTIKDIPCCAYTKMHFSRDNKTLLVTAMNSVRLYNLLTLELIKEWTEKDTSYSNHIVNARFMDDEKKIVVASNKGKIVILDINDFTIIQQFEFEIERIYINRRKYYAENSYTGEITERQSFDICQLKDFIIYMNSVYATFNDGKLRVVQCDSGQIKIKRIDKNIHSIYLSSDKNLVIASYATIKIYNPKSLRLKHSFNIESNIRQEFINEAYLEDNMLIASFDSEKYTGTAIRFYLWENNKFIACQGMDMNDTSNIIRISIDEDFTKLLYLTDAGKVRLWSPPSLSHREICRFNSQIYAIYPFKKGQEVAIETIDEKITIINHINGDIKYVIHKNDIKAIELLKQLGLKRKILNDCIYDKTLDDIVFDKNSSIMTTSGHVIVCGKNGKTLIFDTSSSSVIKELVCPDDYVDCIFNAISPDEKYIVTASHYGNIYIWEFESSLLMQTYNLLDNITSISFSSDGTVILIGTEKGELVSLEWCSFTDLIANQRILFSESFLSFEEKKVFYLQ